MPIIKTTWAEQHEIVWSTPVVGDVVKQFGISDVEVYSPQTLTTT